MSPESIMLIMHPNLSLPLEKPTGSQPADAPGCYYYRRRSAARPRNSIRRLQMARVMTWWSDSRYNFIWPSNY
eukprot:scaffold400773_cov16-Prasinocladus_malaysianus.AAC.1